MAMQIPPGTAEYFREHGYVVLPTFLTADELAPAQADLGLLFPTGEEYHTGADPERNQRFADNAFNGIDLFPYASVEWSLLGLSAPIVDLAETLLGRTDIRLYEAHNWAKYGGAAEYDQPLHRDFGNHTVVMPTIDPALTELEMFIYIHDVPIEAGPTYVVSQQHTRDLPAWPPFLGRDAYPEVYAREIPADGAAGTVLVYRTDTFHRGSKMTDLHADRFLLKSSFRVTSNWWLDKLGLSDRFNKNWYQFVSRATVRQLELVGFPVRGSSYWTQETLAACQLRYPDADLSAFVSES
jgi:ectoine hydroxylase-related dioxygenase (phytanoyl-CoA dioxygenase family)